MKKYLILTVSLICLFAVIFLCFNVFFDNKPITKEEIISIFNNNQNRFVSVQKYLEKSNNISHIYSSNGKIKFSNDDDADNHIDQKIYNDIKYLTDNLGVKLITVDDDRNIEFLFYTNGTERFSIAFYKSGKKPTGQPTDYYYEEISKNWFYSYENQPYT